MNYRLTRVCSGDWHYRLDTLNIAYGPVTPEQFLGTPTHVIHELATLF